MAMRVAHLFIIIIPLKYVLSIPIDNGVEGDPEIECGPNTITVTFNTKNNFEGHVFVKGRYADTGCRSDETGKNTASISLPFSTCGVERQRTLNPKGIFVGVSVVITFHPQFLTKVDRAYSVQCFYMEADKTVSQDLEVSEITTGFQTQLVPMPVCKYDILDGGPNGEPIKFAVIGQQVYHKWTCESETIDIFCMVVHSCYVEDGTANRVQLMDEHGCALDKHLLSNLEYISDLMAGKESHVFKFADKPALFFQCQISVAVKEPEQECPRPQCPETGGLLGVSGGTVAPDAGGTRPSTRSSSSGRTQSKSTVTGKSTTAAKPSATPSLVPPISVSPGQPPSAQPTPPGLEELPVIAAAGSSLPAAASILSLDRGTRRPHGFPKNNTRGRSSSVPPASTKTRLTSPPPTSPKRRASTPPGSTGRPGTSTVRSTTSRPFSSLPSTSSTTSSSFPSTSSSSSSSSTSSSSSSSSSSPTSTSTSTAASSSSSSSTFSSTSPTTSSSSTSSFPAIPSSGSAPSSFPSAPSLPSPSFVPPPAPPLPAPSPAAGPVQPGNLQAPRGSESAAPRFDFESTFPFRLRRVLRSADSSNDYAGTWDVRAPPISAYENFDDSLHLPSRLQLLPSEQQQSPTDSSVDDLYCVPTLLIGLIASATLMSLLASIFVALFLCLRRRGGKQHYVD